MVTTIPEGVYTMKGKMSIIIHNAVLTINKNTVFMPSVSNDTCRILGL
ncbi:MAG: hypothetical protein ACPLSA_07770 [Caldanaerobacter sp.]